jgi:hypothetical protein
MIPLCFTALIYFYHTKHERTTIFFTYRSSNMKFLLVVAAIVGIAVAAPSKVARYHSWHPSNICEVVSQLYIHVFGVLYEIQDFNVLSRRNLNSASKETLVND